MTINKSNVNTTTLAFIGDAVYEVYAREFVLESGQVNADKLHQMAVQYVRAEGQAAALRRIFDILPEEEQSLVKRARNRKPASKPKNVDPVTYKLATAFEALVGYHYLTGNKERVSEIIHFAFEAIDKEERWDNEQSR
jgi:ribonuclease-3 family protein